MTSLVLAVAVGGALGATARWAVARGVAGLYDSALPLGTIAVNVFGAFAFGFLWAYLESRPHLQLRTFLFTGFLGGFTTFSTLAFESVVLIQSGRAQLALVDLLLQNVIGVLAVFGGLWLGRLLA